MGNTNRVSSRVNTVLKEMVDEKRASLPEEEREAFEKYYHDNFVIYHMHEQKKRRIEHEIKNLNYDVLPLFMNVTGLSYMDFFSRVSETVPKWHNDYEKSMNDYLEGLSRSQLKYFTDLFYSLINGDLKSFITEPSTRTIKISKIISYLHDTDAITLMRAAECGVRWKTRWAAVDYANNFPLEKMPEISQLTRIPLHWLASCDDTTNILSANGKVETAMDWFSFLPEEYQKTLCAGVNGGNFNG